MLALKGFAEFVEVCQSVVTANLAQSLRVPGRFSGLACPQNEPISALYKLLSTGNRVGSFTPLIQFFNNHHNDDISISFWANGFDSSPNTPWLWLTDRIRQLLPVISNFGQSQYLP